MNRQELLTRANQFSKSRYGITVTPRQLQDWVSEGLVPGPEPHGVERGVPPDWDWSLLSYRRTLQLCRLQSSGVNGFSRFNEFRIALWMNGADISIETLREALAAEFCRSKNLVLRPINSIWNPRESKPLSDYGRSALLKQMGPVDPRLLPEGFSLSENILLDSYAAMRYGEGSNAASLTDASDLARHCGLSEQEINGLAKFITGLLLLMLNGLAGEPDEVANTAKNSIETASAETFEAARAFCQKFPHLLNLVSESFPEFPPEFQKFLTQFLGPFKIIFLTVRTKSWQAAWLGMWVHCFHQMGGPENFPTEFQAVLKDHVSIS